MAASAKPIIPTFLTFPMFVTTFDPGSRVVGWSYFLVANRFGRHTLLDWGSIEIPHRERRIVGTYKNGNLKKTWVDLSPERIAAGILERMTKVLRYIHDPNVFNVWAIEQLFVSKYQNNRSLIEARGIIKAALAGDGFNWRGYYEPTPGQWKKMAIGNGAANKQAVQAAIRKLYPDLNDLPDDAAQDIFDAAGIGLAAVHDLISILPTSYRHR